jgi:chromosomal replication initiation ATPase DnaA
MPESGALALDDADNVTSEPLLLHLLNTARDRGLTVLLSGRTPPSRWPVLLPDLSSRLRAISAVEIRAPSDDLLASLLMRLLSDRQLNVAPSVQDWMLTRLPRSPGVLRQAVARLDRASLAVGKAITRSLAAEVLADEVMSTADGDGDEVSMSGVDPSSQSPGLL